MKHIIFSNQIRVLQKKVIAGLLFLVNCIVFTGCGQSDYSVPFEDRPSSSSYQILTKDNNKKMNSYATNLCVVKSDLLGDGSINIENSTAAVLFDLNNKEVDYAKNPHTRLYPASITKIMTALVALKYGSLDQELVATSAIQINESGATRFGLKEGDSMTLYQALRILLIHSANDVANMIADNIGGSVDAFVELMNEEAVMLGATNTHFANAHGLTDAEHYTTAYDLYLIFNECIHYEAFTEIISQPEMDVTYKSGGSEIVSHIRNTNGYLSGAYSIPNGVSVIGGKTGTTSAAGYCLIIFAKDTNGSPYISVILQSISSDTLYDDMSKLLNSTKPAANE